MVREQLSPSWFFSSHSFCTAVLAVAEEPRKQNRLGFPTGAPCGMASVAGGMREDRGATCAPRGSWERGEVQRRLCALAPKASSAGEGTRLWLVGDVGLGDVFWWLKMKTRVEKDLWGQGAEGKLCWMQKRKRGGRNSVLRMGKGWWQTQKREKTKSSTEGIESQKNYIRKLGLMQSTVRSHWQSWHGKALSRDAAPTIKRRGSWKR